MKASVATEGRFISPRGVCFSTIEDTDLTFDDLRRMGVALKIIRTLQVLTHDKNVPYMDYIRSIEASKPRATTLPSR